MARSYSAEQKRRIIYNAAKKWGIKASLLYGVWGTETNFGRNNSTSSAGAVGEFQFLPSTASGMGINPYDFHSAAYGAAKYLSQYKSRGTAGMLSAYNAGPAGGIVPSYVSTTLGYAKGWKAPRGVSGGGSGGGGGGSRTIPGQIVGTTTRTPGDPGNIDALSLVRAAMSSAQQPTAPPVSAPTPPSFWSRAALKLPKGYADVASSGAPQPKQDSGVDAALQAISAVQGPTPDQVQTTLGRGPRTRAQGGRGSSGGGKGGIGSPSSYRGTAHFEGHEVAHWIKPWLVYARRHGWKGTVTSGYRSYADQVRIYNSGVRPAARPGTSNHEGADWPRGAVDVSDAAQLSEILRRAHSPLIWAGSKDPVHFSHPHNGSY